MYHIIIIIVLHCLMPAFLVYFDMHRHKGSAAHEPAGATVDPRAIIYDT